MGEYIYLNGVPQGGGLAVLYENRLLSFLIMQQYTDNSLFNKTRGEILAIRFSVDRIGGWEIEKLE